MPKLLYASIQAILGVVSAFFAVMFYADTVDVTRGNQKFDPQLTTAFAVGASWPVATALKLRKYQRSVKR